MLNDHRWLDTKRVVWQRAGALCEWCKRDGYIRAGVDCHHIIPFESAKTQAEMERLFFSPDNITLVCKDCHAKIHRELGSKKKEAVQARRAERFERWKDNINNKNKEL